MFFVPEGKRNSDSELYVISLAIYNKYTHNIYIYTYSFFSFHESELL